VWSPDNSKFYFTDTLNGKILHYDFHLETGELSIKKSLQILIEVIQMGPQLIQTAVYGIVVGEVHV
jgi:sugar lactone lactonase YvrE